MNPWITGRIIEQMQHEARARGSEERFGRHAARPVREPSGPVVIAAAHEPRRARVGLALARLGLRLAGHRDAPAAVRAAVLATPPLDPSDWANPWTTCGATSTSSR